MFAQVGKARTMAIAERELVETTRTMPAYPSIDDIADKVYNGERITADDAARLFHHPNIVELGELADHVRNVKHPNKIVTYIIGRNLNYTNV